MTRHRRSGWLAGLIFVGMVLAGCSSSVAADDPDQSADLEPAYRTVRQLGQELLPIDGPGPDDGWVETGGRAWVGQLPLVNRRVANEVGLSDDRVLAVNARSYNSFDSATNLIIASTRLDRRRLAEEYLRARVGRADAEVVSDAALVGGDPFVIVIRPPDDDRFRFRSVFAGRGDRMVSVVITANAVDDRELDALEQLGVDLATANVVAPGSGGWDRLDSLDLAAKELLADPLQITDRVLDGVVRWGGGLALGLVVLRGGVALADRGWRRRTGAALAMWRPRPRFPVRPDWSNGDPEASWRITRSRLFALRRWTVGLTAAISAFGVMANVLWLVSGAAAAGLGGALVGLLIALVVHRIVGAAIDGFGRLLGHRPPAPRPGFPWRPGRSLALAVAVLLLALAAGSIIALAMGASVRSDLIRYYSDIDRRLLGAGRLEAAGLVAVVLYLLTWFPARALRRRSTSSPTALIVDPGRRAAGVSLRRRSVDQVSGVNDIGFDPWITLYEVIGRRLQIVRGGSAERGAGPSDLRVVVVDRANGTGASLAAELRQRSEVVPRTVFLVPPDVEVPHLVTEVLGPAGITNRPPSTNFFPLAFTVDTSGHGTFHCSTFRDEPSYSAAIDRALASLPPNEPAGQPRPGPPPERVAAPASQPPAEVAGRTRPLAVGASVAALGVALTLAGPPLVRQWLDAPATATPPPIVKEVGVVNGSETIDERSYLWGNDFLLLPNGLRLDLEPVSVAASPELGLVVLDRHGGLIAVDPETGEERWRRAVSDTTWSVAVSGPSLAYTDPADGSVTIVQSAGDPVSIPVDGHPLALRHIDDRLVVALADGGFAVVDPASGSVVRRDLGGRRVADFAVVGDRLVVDEMDSGRLWAFDGVDGNGRVLGRGDGPIHAIGDALLVADANVLTVFHGEDLTERTSLVVNFQPHVDVAPALLLTDDRVVLLAERGERPLTFARCGPVVCTRRERLTG